MGKVQAESSSDVGKVRVLQRDNTALHVRIKGLLAEVEELRSEKEKQALDADSIQRTQEKQIADLQATLRSLEVGTASSCCKAVTSVFKTKRSLPLSPTLLCHNTVAAIFRTT